MIVKGADGMYTNPTPPPGGAATAGDGLSAVVRDLRSLETRVARLEQAATVATHDAPGTLLVDRIAIALYHTDQEQMRRRHGGHLPARQTWEDVPPLNQEYHRERARILLPLLPCPEPERVLPDVEALAEAFYVGEGKTFYVDPRRDFARIDTEDRERYLSTARFAHAHLRR